MKYFKCLEKNGMIIESTWIYKNSIWKTDLIFFLVLFHFKIATELENSEDMYLDFSK